MNKKYITLAVYWAYFHTKRLLALHKAFINVLFYCLYTKWVYVRILSFPVRGVGFHLFFFHWKIFNSILHFLWYKLERICFDIVVCNYSFWRKPLKFVSPNSINIYQFISSDKFSKKLVNKQISMDEYFMLKCLCQKWCHESFAIFFYELEADKKCCSKLSETPLEHVMIFAYQILEYSLILRTIW